MILAKTGARFSGIMRDAGGRRGMQKYLPKLVWYEPFEPYGYAFIRICTGATVAWHGAARLFFGTSAAELGALKGLPAGLIGGFELIAGVMLAAGLLTRPVALLIGLEWLAIALAVPMRPGQSWLMTGATPRFPAMIALFCLAFLLGGGGPHSADRRIGKEI
jgi:putative oxidoreductase